MQQGGKALVGCGLRGKCLQPAPKNLLLEARLAAGPVRMLSPPGYTREGHLLGLGVVWLSRGPLPQPQHPAGSLAQLAHTLPTLPLCPTQLSHHGAGIRDGRAQPGFLEQ